VIGVGELLRATVEGFKIEGFLLVEGDHFGKRSSVILTEYLTLSRTEMQQKKKQSQGEESQHSQHILDRLQSRIVFCITGYCLAAWYS